MLKRMLSLALTLALALLPCLAAIPARAEEYGTSRTTLAGSSAAKINNIDLAIAAIDGVFVPYGAEFSFNDIVGPRTQEAGYLGAMNGRGATVVGGGVSQVATTLYMALMNLSGYIAFGELDVYGSRFVDNYVDDGALAIITDYRVGHDLSFTNYAGDMLIEIWENGSYIYCTITVSDDDDGGDNWFGGWVSGPEQQLIASASLYCGNDASVLHNVALAAACVDDTTLSAGDVFSFNGVVGPRSASYGYLSAVNGRGVNVVGGGVAQVASAIWLAVKGRGDIAIIEKSTYGDRYNQSYVANSSDAIVTDYNADTDFSFRYTGGDSITLSVTLEYNTLTCSIYR